MDSNLAASSPPAIRSRNAWLDKLRGAAALMVVFFHLNAEAGFSGNVWREIAAYGNRGVEIFFLLSGFCIYAAAQRANGVGEFAWHRWWRVFPPYYFSLLVVIGVAVARKLTVGVNDALNPASHGKALSFLLLELPLVLPAALLPLLRGPDLRHPPTPGDP